MVLHPTVGLAFLAGLVSFLSPCVFPLVPVYAGYLGGRASTAPLTADGPGAAVAVPRGRPVLLNGVAFVLGFSAVFILFYYVFSALAIGVFTQHQQLFDLVAGIIIIAFALQALGIIRFSWLVREFRFHRSPVPGVVGSTVLGISFACGWSPCLGPQLGAILTLARAGDFGGLPFMLLYCLGLAVPFLLVAVLAQRGQGLIRSVNRHLNLINMIAGGLLLVFGLLLVTGRITLLSQLSPQSPFDL
jgi:cytochrome c-type biogenesis protein